MKRNQVITDYIDISEKDKINLMVADINQGKEIWIGPINKNKALKELNANADEALLKYKKLIEDIRQAIVAERIYPILKLRSLSFSTVKIILKCLSDKEFTLLHLDLNEKSLNAALASIKHHIINPQSNSHYLNKKAKEINLVFTKLSITSVKKLIDIIANDTKQSIKTIVIYPKGKSYLVETIKGKSIYLQLEETAKNNNIELICNTYDGLVKQGVKSPQSISYKQLLPGTTMYGQTYKQEAVKSDEKLNTTRILISPNTQTVTIFPALTEHQKISTAKIKINTSTSEVSISDPDEQNSDKNNNLSRPKK